MNSFDRFDIVFAYRMYAVLWGGDGCDYENGVLARIARLDVRVGRNERHLCGLTPNAREIYGNLVTDRQRTGYVHCACCGMDTIGAAGVALCFDCEAAGCEPICGECPACRGRSCQCEETEEEYSEAGE